MEDDGIAGDVSLDITVDEDGVIVVGIVDGVVGCRSF